MAVSKTTARCCALRSPTLPSSHPAPPGLAALGKNFTAKGKPLQVTSGCCLQIERGFKDSLGTRGAWAGTLPTAARRLGGSMGLLPALRCHPPPVLPPAKPCHSRRSGYVPSHIPGASTVLPAWQKGRRCWRPASGLHSFLSVMVLSQLICFRRRGVVGCASAGFPAVRVRNGT